MMKRFAQKTKEPQTLRWIEGARRFKVDTRSEWRRLDASANEAIATALRANQTLSGMALALDVNIATLITHIDKVPELAQLHAEWDARRKQTPGHEPLPEWAIAARGARPSGDASVDAAKVEQTEGCLASIFAAPVAASSGPQAAADTAVSPETMAAPVPAQAVAVAVAAGASAPPVSVVASFEIGGKRGVRVAIAGEVNGMAAAHPGDLRAAAVMLRALASAMRAGSAGA